MQVKYFDPAKPDMIDGEWRSPLCDEQGRLVVVSSGGGGGGDATAANQATQIAAEEAIATNTLIATGWFPSQSKRYTSVGAGIDLTTAVPGKTCIALIGARTATTGIIQLEFVGNAPGELYEANFGAGAAQYGQFKKIDATTTGSFPLFALFV